LADPNIKAQFRTGLVDEELYKFDKYAHAVTVISEPHRMNHDGFMQSVTYKRTALADAASQDFLLAVPALTWPHLNKAMIRIGRGDVDILAYEGPTTTAAGTVLTPFNTNRSSSNTPNMVITRDPTVTVVGTLMQHQWLPPTIAGTGGSASGVSEAEAGEEWLLAPDTDYLWRITNESGAAVDLAIEILWYELDYYD